MYRQPADITHPPPFSSTEDQAALSMSSSQKLHTKDDKYFLYL